MLGGGDLIGRKQERRALECDVVAFIAGDKSQAVIGKLGLGSKAGANVVRGRLLRGPFPKGGKPLILEARAGRSRWIEFDVVRSDSHGRFHASYRFKFPGPVHYQFRALCEHEADYPYAGGTSRVIGVLER